MVRALSCLPVLAALIATPAYAGDTAARVQVSSGPLQAAIGDLARQWMWVLN